MSEVTWKTYNWGQHAEHHYIIGEIVYAPMMVTNGGDDYEKDCIGFIQSDVWKPNDVWALPFGTHLQDNQTVAEAVDVAFRKLFHTERLNKHIEETSSIGDTLFTCDVNNASADPGKGILAEMHTARISSIHVDETLLNDHIRNCTTTGERPRWNTPGKHRYYTLFYRLLTGHSAKKTTIELYRAKSSVMRDIQFFNEEEIKEEYLKGKIVKDDYRSVCFYFDNIRARKHEQSTQLVADVQARDHTRVIMIFMIAAMITALMRELFA